MDTNMESLDIILQHGPADNDHIAGLDKLRNKILLDGIPANNEGMVCFSSSY